MRRSQFCKERLAPPLLSRSNALRRRADMAEATRELVVVITHGMDDERSSIAFTIANGGLTAGLQVSIFLTSAAVDLVLKRAIEGLVVHPLEPLAALVKDFVA